MKIDELRKELKSAKKDEVALAAVFLYKQLKKAQKEEIDAELLDVLHGASTGKKKAVRKEPPMDFDALIGAVEEFVDNADEGLYYYANRTVSKTKRSNWRHEIKKYYDQLISIEPQSENYQHAGELLWKLYWILARGTTFHTFVSDTPFYTANLPQKEFMGMLASRFCTPETSQEDLEEFMFLFCGAGMEGWSSRESLYPILAERVQDPDFLDRVLAALEEQYANTKPMGFDRLDAVYEDYMCNNAYHSIPQLILYLMTVTQDDPKEAIFSIFKKYLTKRLEHRQADWLYQSDLSKLKKRDKEGLARLNGKVIQPDLKELLHAFEIAGRDDLWTGAYEDAVSSMNFIPGDSIRKDYEKKKNPQAAEEDNADEDGRTLIVFR